MLLNINKLSVIPLRIKKFKFRKCSFVAQMKWMQHKFCSKEHYKNMYLAWKWESLHYIQNTSSIHDHGQRRILSNKNLIAVVKDSDFLFEFRVFEYWKQWTIYLKLVFRFAICTIVLASVQYNDLYSNILEVIFPLFFKIVRA